ncbi:MAG: FtsQ-type POTRA domain-containing protein [Thermoleophilia bacterium]|nr:FtsQ-type POTRA domain-containing protein [Thermoleophilia bacterium]
MARRKSPVQHTAELARGRERRRRRFTILAILLLLAGVGLYAGYQYWFRDSSLVEIRDLQVKGVTTDTEEGKQIQSAVEVAAGEMTTLHLKPELLDEELARFPRVRSATIEASFPHKATVNLDQRSNGSVLRIGTDALLIATDGTVLGTAGQGTEDLPKIGAGDPPAGDQLEGRMMVQALVLGAVPTELRSYVIQSDFGKDGVEVTLSNGLVLLFGDASKADQKWRAAASVIADPDLYDASYVDLSVPRRPAVRGPEALEPEPEAVPEVPETVPPTG